MNDAFIKLSDTDLQSLIGALRSGRVAAPYSSLQVARVVPNALTHTIRDGLLVLESQGFSAAQIASALDLIAVDRASKGTAEPPIDLVTSGPEAPGITNRDTAVVVRELFAHARQSVLLVGYAVYQGQRVFETLAKRMNEHPTLDVQFFLNVSRRDGDATPKDILVAQFKQRFRDSQWPAGYRLPEVFYDPRSVADDQPIRSSLHAKCVVVDTRHVFVSSANFTEAGQERNVEVGLHIESPWLASRLCKHFAHLRACGLAERAF